MSEMPCRCVLALGLLAHREHLLVDPLRQPVELGGEAVELLLDGRRLARLEVELAALDGEGMEVRGVERAEESEM